MTVRELHTKAMAAADAAIAARRAEQPAQALFEQAFDFEQQALELLLQTEHRDSEPTRSVLARSAATLALDCGKHREAERLASFGLAGQPPTPIDAELREVWDRRNSIGI